MKPDDSFSQRAWAAARVMTVRGLLIRVATACGGLAVISMVTPAEFGLLAIVRAVTAALEQGTELGLVWPLLRQREHPTRDEYASLAGAQLLIVLAVIGAAALWRPAGTVFHTLDARWRSWLLGMLAAMITIPLGTGARVRLERELRYTRIAFAEVSAMLLHTLVLIGFLLAGQFAIGIFVAQMAITLYLNGLLYASSPGPLPTWHVGRALKQVQSCAGYTVAYLVFVAREQAPPLLVAALFGLRAAGTWAFALRLAKFVQFAHEGFARIAVPAAARLAPDRLALRQLATQSLTGAAVVAIPAAFLVAFALPAVPLFWPQWALAVPLAIIYVLCDATVGVLAAGLAPIALALRGWRAILIEHAVPLLIALGGLILLWRLGRDALQFIVIPVSVGATAALFAITDAEVWPAWQSEYTRLVAALASGLIVYIASRALGLHPVVTAAAGSTALGLWLWPQWLTEAGLAKGSIR